MKKRLAGLGAALALTAVAAAAHAADYYVAPGGSANNAGTMAAPWTFAKAVGSTGAAPGDTVWIRRGTYNGAVNFTGSGNAGAWITFRAYQGELPIIQGSGGSGVSSSSAQYVRFVGVAVRNFSSSGFGGKSTRTSRGPRGCRMGENTCAAREVRV